MLTIRQLARRYGLTDAAVLSGLAAGTLPRPTIVASVPRWAEADLVAWERLGCPVLGELPDPVLDRALRAIHGERVRARRKPQMRIV